MSNKSNLCVCGLKSPITFQQNKQQKEKEEIKEEKKC